MSRAEIVTRMPEHWRQLYLTVVILQLRLNYLYHGVPGRYAQWPRWELEALVELYPWFPNRELAGIFCRGRPAIKTRAQKSELRLMKAPETIRRIWNEIVLPGGCRTRFRKGQRPQTWKPVGTVVCDPDGYLKCKIRGDTPAGLSRRNWGYLHVQVWERHHGPVPDGHNVVFRNGDKTDIRIENLELVSDAELLRRNTYHRYPEPIRLAIAAKSQLTRVINELERKAA